MNDIFRFLHFQIHGAALERAMHKVEIINSLFFGCFFPSVLAVDNRYWRMKTGSKGLVPHDYHHL